MTASFERSVASGSTANFSVPFPYLDKSHVKVSLDGVLLDPATDYTWPNAGEIQLTAGNPAVGTVVERRRVTPTETLTVFAPGNLDSGDLNVGVLQPLYVAQEASDRADDIVDRAWFTNGFQPGGEITKGVPAHLPMFGANGDLEDSGVDAEALLDASTAAVAAALTATTQAGIATSGAGTATTAKNDAVSAKNLAQQWAANPEDSVVSGGLYSALHYAAKAAASLGSITNGLAGWIHGATLKATPIDADEFGFWDSVSGALRKLTLGNLKDVFKASPYLPIGGPAPTDPDLNTYVSGGFQGRIQLSTTSIPNAPPATGLFYVLVFETTSTRTTQLLIPYTAASQGIWFRTQTTSWSAWERFARIAEVLPLVGGTMTGKITLDGNPSSNLHASPKQYVDAHPGVAKAWVNFNGTGTVAIQASYNVSSITDNGTGDYTINFATALASANYAIALSTRILAAAGGGGLHRVKEGVAPTVSALRIDTCNFSGTLTDPVLVTAAVF